MCFILWDDIGTHQINMINKNSKLQTQVSWTQKLINLFEVKNFNTFIAELDKEN